MSATADNEKPPPPPPLRVALIGAGLFATNSHAPVLLDHPDIFEIKAVWSRRQESAQILVQKLNCHPDVAHGGDNDFETLLARSDIDAFIVALPLDVQPTFVIKMLKAGKHVMSEKPIAPTVAAAKQLLQEYQAINENRRSNDEKSLIWTVAENFRYEPGIQKAAEIVQAAVGGGGGGENDKGIIGQVMLMQLTVKNPFLPDNAYLNTSWRKTPTWYGGLFIDAFIHAAAGIRAIIPASVSQVSAVTSHCAPEYLPGPDTMVGHVTWSSGVHCSITASYASDTFLYEFEITGRKGTVLLQRSTSQPGYNLVITKGMGNNTRIVRNDFFQFQGLTNEFLAFAAACRHCGDQTAADVDAFLNTPEQALQDLELVEALLVSGKQGGAVVQLR